MDLLIYCAVLDILGYVRFYKTQQVADTVGIVDTGATTTANCDLPIASNLGLVKEAGAYTLILEELGLRW